MSTRAIYTFRDQPEWSNEEREFHVYKHSDGYPSGGLLWIQRAIKNAWKFPRFEAPEFAAAFIAGNKSSQGGVYLTEGPQAHGDLSYKYLIEFKEGQLVVAIFSYNYANDDWDKVDYGMVEVLLKKYQDGDYE